MIAHGVFRDDELCADERAAATLGIEAHDVCLSGGESEALSNCGETLGLPVLTLGEARGESRKEAKLGRLMLSHEGEGDQQHPEDHDCKRLGVEVMRKHAREHEPDCHGDGKQCTPAQAKHRVGGHVTALRDVCQHIPHKANRKHLRCGEDCRRQVPQRYAEEDTCSQAACDDEHGGEPQAHGIACLVRLAVRACKHGNRNDDSCNLAGQTVDEGQSEHVAHDGHGHGDTEYNEGNAQEYVLEDADIARVEHDRPSRGRLFALARAELDRPG